MHTWAMGQFDNQEDNASRMDFSEREREVLREHEFVYRQEQECIGIV